MPVGTDAPTKVRRIKPLDVTRSVTHFECGTVRHAMLVSYLKQQEARIEKLEAAIAELTKPVDFKAVAAAIEAFRTPQEKPAPQEPELADGWYAIKASASSTARIISWRNKGKWCKPDGTPWLKPDTPASYFHDVELLYAL